MTIQQLKTGHVLWKDMAEYAKHCSWPAGKLLAKKMQKQDFKDWERIFIALEEGRIVGYCTLAKEDCISDVSYTPYIGYVFVEEACRGKRYSEKLINVVLEYAGELGFERVYLVSDHVNLYEKYGFVKIDEKPAPWNPDIMESIFMRETKAAEMQQDGKEARRKEPMEQKQAEKVQAERQTDNKEQAILEQITEAMRECAQIMLQADHDHAGVDEKAGKANLVTKYDKMVQEAIREKLLDILPEAVFVGEEEDIHASIKEGLAFIVDPIDGTNNFIKDYRCSAISVGVTKDGKAYMGAVYNPYLDEMFTAVAGQGAFLNGKAIHVSGEPLKNGIVIFGTSPYYEDLAEQSFRLAYEYFQKAMDVRRSGSAALDLCNVAAGRAELFFELRLSPWDFAAGSLIVTEAGGKVSQIDGSPVDLSKPCPVLATNGR